MKFVIPRYRTLYNIGFLYYVFHIRCKKMCTKILTINIFYKPCLIHKSKQRKTRPVPYYLKRSFDVHAKTNCNSFRVVPDDKL